MLGALNWVNCWKFTWGPSNTVAITTVNSFSPLAGTVK
jgi:hypothetical protein